MGEDCCKEEGCCQDKLPEGYDEMTHMMMHLADSAWNDLMMDKIKKALDKERGSFMNNAAELVVKHSIATWKLRMKENDNNANLSKEEVEKFKADLNKAFMG